MPTQSKKAIVVLGAGASHDCANGTSGLIEGLRPPLARSLFANNSTVHEYLDVHPGARRIQSTQRDLSHSPEIDIERRLQEISVSTVFARSFVEVPLYLRDYIRACSGFLRGRAETYGELVAKLRETGHQVAFVSLNYDTLLEQALTEILGLRFDRLSDYVARDPLVIKPHGSTNWFWAFKRDTVAPEQFMDSLVRTPEGPLKRPMGVVVHDPSPPTQATQIKVLKTGSDWIVTNGADYDIAWIYPALTAPLATKGDADIVCPEEHIQALHEFQSNCTKYLFVGTAGFDSHVLGRLGSHAEQRLHFSYVGSGADEDVKRAAMRVFSGLKSGREQHPSLAAQQFNHSPLGFTNWVYSDHFADFLRA